MSGEPIQYPFVIRLINQAVLWRDGSIQLEWIDDVSKWMF